MKVLSDGSVSEAKANEILKNRRAAMFAASAIWIFGIFLGSFGYRILGIGESELYDRLIERYFLALFYKCGDFSDVLSVICECYVYTLIPFICVYLGGYTLFTLPVSIGALLRQGILYGFALTMLQFSSKAGLLVDSICYLCVHAAIAVLLAVMAVYAMGYFYPTRSRRFFSYSSMVYCAVFLKIAALVFVNLTLLLFLLYVYL